MAVIEGDFDPEIIRKTRGVLDYYYYRGRLVVRSWPRKPVLPRSPNVQATAADFRDTARALSELPLVLQDITREVVKGTSWTWRDAWTTALYGHNIEFGAPETPPPEDNATPLVILRLATTNAAALTTVNVNSTSYIRISTQWDFNLDCDLFLPTQFRIVISGQSNAAGQTITAQLARTSAPATPLSAAGNDLVITNTNQLWDSGWISITDTLSGFESLCVAFKGSNTTVDINQIKTDVHFYQPLN